MQEKDEACGLPKVDDLLKEMEATVAASRLEDVMRERDRIQLKVAMREYYAPTWEEEQRRRQYAQEMEYRERRYRTEEEEERYRYRMADEQVRQPHVHGARFPPGRGAVPA